MQTSLQHTGSSTVMCRLYSTWAQLRSTCLVVVCGISVPNQRLNPGSLHWECRVLTTEPPGKSQEFISISSWGWRQSVLHRRNSKDRKHLTSRRGRDIRARGMYHQDHGGRPFSKHKRTPHTVSICTYILGNSSFDHTSHINLGKTTYKPWDGLDQKPPWELLLLLNYPAVIGILWRRVWQKVKINK